MRTDLKATLKWERDMVFAGRTPRGYELDFDSEAEWGCTPVESLLLSIGGCMAMDIVSILVKMRCPPSEYSMDLEAERADGTPRRITKVRLAIRAGGEGVTEEKLDRAIEFSRDRYCSVLHSLRPDIELEVERTVA